MHLKVLVIGAGKMGAAFVQRLHAAGHEVSVTARTGDRSVTLAGRYLGVRAVSPHDAAAGKDLIILATGYLDAEAALRSVGDLAGTVVVDVTIPLTGDGKGLVIGHETSAAEEIARAIPGARVVKAFNTVHSRLLATQSGTGTRLSVPVFAASDDDAARHMVLALAQDLGFETIDAGSLKNARYLEPLAAMNVYLACQQGRGTAIAPTWLRQA